LTLLKDRVSSSDYREAILIYMPPPSDRAKAFPDFLRVTTNMGQKRFEANMLTTRVSQ